MNRREADFTVDVWRDVMEMIKLFYYKCHYWASATTLIFKTLQMSLMYLSICGIAMSRLSLFPFSFQLNSSPLHWKPFLSDLCPPSKQVLDRAKARNPVSVHILPKECHQTAHGKDDHGYGNCEFITSTLMVSRALIALIAPPFFFFNKGSWAWGLRMGRI